MVFFFTIQNFRTCNRVLFSKNFVAILWNSFILLVNFIEFLMLLLMKPSFWIIMESLIYAFFFNLHIYVMTLKLTFICLIFKFFLFDHATAVRWPFDWTNDPMTRLIDRVNVQSRFNNYAYDLLIITTFSLFVMAI